MRNIQIALGGEAAIEAAAEANVSLLTGGGSSAARWIWLGWCLGSDESPGSPIFHIGSDIGADVMLPVFDPTTDNESEAATAPTSSIGVAAPGDPAIKGVAATLIGSQPGDQVQLELRPCAVWDITDPTNWCMFRFATATLEHVEGDHKPAWHPAEEELEIVRQSGDDFSVGDAGGHAALLSAAGGTFQSSIFAYTRLL